MKRGVKGGKEGKEEKRRMNRSKGEERVGDGEGRGKRGGGAT